MDPITVTFEPWFDPDIDRYLQPVEGTYSRLAWLPTVGPSAWLIWGTVAAQLRLSPAATWRLADLANAHGLGSGDGPNSTVTRTLRRLHQFGLMTSLDDGRKLARLSAPPLSAGLLAQRPSFVADLHDRTFSHPAST